MRGEKEWLANLKAGDKAATGNRMYGYSIITIDKVTETQIVSGERRYNRRNGMLRGGDSYNFTYLEPVTDEIRHRIAASFVQHFTTTVDFKLATLDELAQLKTLLKAIKSREPNKGTVSEQGE